VVIASPSYPYGEAADEPSLVSFKDLEEEDFTVVFASSIKLANETQISTGKGRVFVIVSDGETFGEAREKAYQRVARLRALWPSSQVRLDIAKLVESSPRSNV
jgi:phosphoribosylamine-glycine ligase